MAIIHDGITAPLRPTLLGLILALGPTLGGGWLALSGNPWLGGPIVVLGLLFALNLRGVRRIHVIHSKLLVEDEWMLRTLLIGPARRRIEWKEVKSAKVEGGRLVLETAGAPFVTGEGAPESELTSLLERVNAAMARAKTA